MRGLRFLSFFKHSDQNRIPAEEPSYLERYIFLSISIIFIFSFFLFFDPIAFGDGLEYHLVNQAFFNHLSPDGRPQDPQVLESLQIPKGYAEQIEETRYHLVRLFRRGSDGKYYSWHFWLYPLVALPAKASLHFLGLNETKAFQITNCLSLLLAVYFILFKTNLNRPRKIFFLFLATVNPILWFIICPHPEVFVYSLMVIAITYHMNGSYARATLFSSIAAMQFQAFIAIPFYFAARASGASLTRMDILGNFNMKRFLRVLPFLSLNFIPWIWYYWKCGAINLIAASEAAHHSNITLGKGFGILFDANQGLLPYSPGIVILFFLSLFILLRKLRTRSDKDALILIPLVLGLTVGLCTRNWNGGTFGPQRYIVCFLPLILFFIVTYVNINDARRSIACAIVFSVILQIVVIGSCGFLRYKGARYKRHNLVATFLLDHFPRLYSPPYEIFYERTLHKEGYPEKFPVVYRNRDGHVTKILSNGRNINKLFSELKRNSPPSEFNIEIKEELREEYNKNKGKALFYINR